MERNKLEKIKKDQNTSSPEYMHRRPGTCRKRLHICRHPGQREGLPWGVSVPATAPLPVTLLRRQSGEEEFGQQKGKVASQGPVNREEVGRETLRGSKVGKQMHMGYKKGTREPQGLNGSLGPNRGLVLRCKIISL